MTPLDIQLKYTNFVIVCPLQMLQLMMIPEIKMKRAKQLTYTPADFSSYRISIKLLKSVSVYF